MQKHKIVHYLQVIGQVDVLILKLLGSLGMFSQQVIILILELSKL